MTNKKIFVVGIIGVVLLLGGRLVLSESAFPKKVIDIQQINKEIQKISKEFKKLKDFKVKGIVPLEEIKKEETPVIESQECDETCGIPCNFYEFMAKAQSDEVKDIIEKAVAQCPESPEGHYWHKKLAFFLRNDYYDKGKDPTILEQAIKEAEQALKSSGWIDYQLTSLLSELLVESKDVKTLDRIFEKVLATEEGRKWCYDDYIEALIKLNDPRTEEVLQKVLKEKPVTDDYDWIVMSAAKWFLDQGRESEVLLLPAIDYPYMYFYRGVALERIGQLKEAKSEYTKYRAYYRKENLPLPNMPKRFQIPGSELQKEMKIRFEGDASSTRIQATTAISDEQAIKGLSYLIYGEAQGETLGGMRAVGWIVRSRVLRGSVGPSSCRLYVNNTGSTLADKYKSVMCQSGQFNGMCKAWCSDPNTTECKQIIGRTDVSAKAVYNGSAPDPVGQHCPGGITNWGGSYCADSSRCYGYKDTYRLAGPVLNYGTSGSCPSPHPGIGCGPDSVGKTCGNGGLDNCFYPKPEYCSGFGCVTYSGSLSQPGQCAYSAYFYSSVTGYHKGHLEGPESNYNQVDFDLYFWKWNGSRWQQVASSIRYGSVDDINYYGTPGYYIWGVCAYAGSGSLTLYTSRPQ